MSVATDTRWLLLVFSLPAKRATARVEVWRTLRRIGALPLGSSGYLLPFTPQNHERFEWLAVSIGKHKGQASVIQVASIDDLPTEELVRRFSEARSRDYKTLLQETSKLKRSNGGGRQLAHLQKRFQDIASIDFFDSPLRSRAEAALARAAGPPEPPMTRSSKRKQQFQNRVWITRKRPGIDRVSSAWLIRKFIDPHASFVFGDDPKRRPEAIPFDMFHPGGFGHRGDHCTFETLRSEFGIRDRGVAVISEMIHDADLGDRKFSRTEAIGLDNVLIGWAQLGVSDEELLRRGIDLIEGLYHSISK